MHQLKLSEWQSPSGRYYCGDTSDLGNESGYWYHLARVWDLTGPAFISLLVDTYKVDKISYNSEKDVLIFSWSNYGKQHQFLLDTNKLSRKKNFQIC